MGILFGELNPDEYDIEVDAITGRIEADSSVNEIAKVIFDVFSAFFWPDCVSMIECTKAAFHIKENIISDENH